MYEIKHKKVTIILIDNVILNIENGLLMPKNGKNELLIKPIIIRLIILKPITNIKFSILD